MPMADTIAMPHLPAMETVFAAPAVDDERQDIKPAQGSSGIQRRADLLRVRRRRRTRAQGHRTQRPPYSERRYLGAADGLRDNNAGDAINLEQLQTVHVSDGIIALRWWSRGSRTKSRTRSSTGFLPFYAADDILIHSAILAGWMVSKGLTGVGFRPHHWDPRRIELRCPSAHRRIVRNLVSPRTPAASGPREGGYPVRRGLSVQSLRASGDTGAPGLFSR